MNKFFRNNKVYIIVFVILIIYFVVFRFISFAINKENSKYASIIVDGVNIWEYKESKWMTLTEEEFMEQDTLYDLYSNAEYYGDYTIRLNNKKLYAFDSKYNSLQYKDSILAINSNYDIDVYFFGYSDVNKEDERILNGVIDNNYNNKIRKISLDVNDDDKHECFYIVDYYVDGVVSFTDIYYYNGKLREVINKGSNYLVYDIAYILDINDDGNYEIIISSNYLDTLNYKVYRLDGKSYRLYIE